MNTLVNRFSTTGPSNELRKAREDFDDEEIGDAMWGSGAGFGNLTKFGPTFGLPAVADVCPLSLCN